MEGHFWENKINNWFPKQRAINVCRGGGMWLYNSQHLFLYLLKNVHLIYQIQWTYIAFPKRILWSFSFFFLLVGFQNWNLNIPTIDLLEKKLILYSEQSSNFFIVIYLCPKNYFVLFLTSIVFLKQGWNSTIGKKESICVMDLLVWSKFARCGAT